MLERCLRTAYRVPRRGRTLSSVTSQFAKDDKSGQHLQQARFESPDIKDIAILGGGITGLTSAYFAALLHPNAKVTLFEGSKRLGGWLISTKHETNGGTVIFEQGPRSLRPSKGTLALVWQPSTIYLRRLRRLIVPVDRSTRSRK